MIQLIHFDDKNKIAVLNTVKDGNVLTVNVPVKRNKVDDYFFTNEGVIYYLMFSANEEQTEGSWFIVSDEEYETKYSHKYGTIRVFDQFEQPANGKSKLRITDYVQASFADHRLVSVMGVEDNSVVIGVENPESTGRCPQQTMRLTMESFIGMLTTCMMYLEAKGMNVGEELIKSVSSGEVNYNYTDNLKNPFHGKENDNNR